MKLWKELLNETLITLLVHINSEMGWKESKLFTRKIITAALWALYKTRCFEHEHALAKYNISLLLHRKGITLKERQLNLLVALAMCRALDWLIIY